jgi:hypothetical protein
MLPAADLEKLASTTKFSGMTRQQVIALMGTPDATNDVYYWGDGRTDRVDSYNLSPSKDRILDINYDSRDVVTSYGVSSRSCGCPECSAEAPATTFEIVNKQLFRKDAAQAGKSLTIAQLDSMVGQPGKRSFSQNVVGGRVWTNYTEIWRIAGNEHRFLVASGHRGGAMDPEFLHTGPGGLSILSYSLLSLSPRCFGR